jgi:cystathionine beta-lyase/cystathionine gamma-synthase
LFRKNEELKLLNGFLAGRFKLRQPRSVDEVIEQKFHLAAALKAEHDLHDWPHTETAWTHSRRPLSGALELRYDYQRADLEVRGPSFYAFEQLTDAETVYTASGMAAISALLMALRPVFSEADFITLPNAYGETTELIEGHVRHLRSVVTSASLEVVRERHGL